MDHAVYYYKKTELPLDEQTTAAFCDLNPQLH